MAVSTSQTKNAEERNKHSDYDHISGQQYVMSFPTSSRDIESMYKGPIKELNSPVVPQPCLTSKNRHGVIRIADVNGGQKHCISSHKGNVKTDGPVKTVRDTGLRLLSYDNDSDYEDI